jgi:hypothetical protein
MAKDITCTDRPTLARLSLVRLPHVFVLYCYLLHFFLLIILLPQQGPPLLYFFQKNMTKDISVKSENGHIIRLEALTNHIGTKHSLLNIQQCIDYTSYWLPLQNIGLKASLLLDRTLSCLMALIELWLIRLQKLIKV